MKKNLFSASENAKNIMYWLMCSNKGEMYNFIQTFYFINFLQL